MPDKTQPNKAQRDKPWIFRTYGVLEGDDTPAKLQPRLLEHELPEHVLIRNCRIVVTVLQVERCAGKRRGGKRECCSR